MATTVDHSITNTARDDCPRDDHDDVINEDFLVINENVDTLVSSIDKSNPSNNAQNYTTSSGHGESPRQRKNCVYEMPEKQNYLIDSSTHIVSFLPLQQDGIPPGKHEDIPSSIEHQDTGSTGESKNSFISQNATPTEAVPDANNNMIIAGSDFSDKTDVGAFITQKDQEVPEHSSGSSLKEHIDGERLDKYLELAAVEIRPMSKPKHNDGDEESGSLPDQQQTSADHNQLPPDDADVITTDNSRHDADGSSAIADATSVIHDTKGSMSDSTNITHDTPTVIDETTKQDNKKSLPAHTTMDNPVQTMIAKSNSNNNKVKQNCTNQPERANHNVNFDEVQKSPTKSGPGRSSDQKQINSKRIDDRSQFLSQLIRIDGMSVGTRAASREGKQRTGETLDQLKRVTGDSATTQPRSSSMPPHKKSALARGNYNLLNKNIEKTGTAHLITTPSARNQYKGDHFTDQRKSHQTDNHVDSNHGARLNTDDLYGPFARTNSKHEFEVCHTQNGDRKTPRPSVSKFEKPYTRHELRRALPRKSFFSSHEKAMKDAGFEVDDPVARRKAERLKAKLDRIAKEFDNLIVVTGKEPTSATQSDVKVIVTEDAGGDNPKPEDDTDENDTATVGQENSSTGEDQKPSLSEVCSVKTLPSNTTKKKRPTSAKVEYVECKPLSLYLEYVKDNRQEYIQHAQSSRKVNSDLPTARLIKLGQIFQLRHQVGIPRHEEDDVIVMAAKALRPRTADPAKFSKQQKDKGLWTTDSVLRQMRPLSDDKRQQDKTTSGTAAPTTTATTTAGKEDEHPKTEFERRKVRAEDWSRSVNTQMLTRAKIQSLRELGTDDVELTRWWEAFRRCQYLRQSYS